MKYIYEPCPGAFDHIADCAVCGCSVGIQQNGKVNGAQMADQSWVCSAKCRKVIDKKALE